jgi:hypothetical protein
MKKIFTLLVAVGMITLAQAQPGYGKNNGYDHRNNHSTGDKGYHDRNDNGRDDAVLDNDRRYNGIMSPTKQRDLAIDRINRVYDWKIEKVRDNFYKSRYEKKRQIRFLNEKRKREIRRTYYEFSKERRRDDFSNRRY